ncbi:Rogdi leucine zipper containing protein [Trichophyton interdigitale]|uniref:Rogdi leucine zipper containing protein n=2 Tax=Trichophyton interdigitale TaxID=101480 RepID=A0A9P4YEX5_9EURO|nr:hypothetical protein H101_01542 [Trichophyton interdigitale H6]KAF3891894.1 Rogdi leucine zipper containing protein [Trichophyton interdigitale]KAG5210885.1 Rogdi leucine zipper containing protein [Trichophyton interdigitale]KAG8207432.1 Rogdi leucine zipper containing protein [Trichophyton interdigitale]KDB22119.1 hypothetical protein H109_05963 [Trichophyton interdigitale MR816]
MAAWAYPPLPAERLKEKEEASLSNELQWLLNSLQGTLASLRDGLQECYTLLTPNDTGSTLVLSSMRSESVKGFVTRMGSKIVKGDVQLRLHSLPPPRGSPSTRLCLSSDPAAPELVLNQLSTVRRLINDSLDIVDISTYTGDSRDASFISGQLRLLGDNLAEARQTLKGEGEGIKQPWFEGSADGNSFDPPLPPYLSFHLSISEAALVLYLRTLEPASTESTPSTSFAPHLSLGGFSLRDQLFGVKQPTHDETGDVFQWRGEEVRVQEKVRVESQDPSLLSAMAKISALEHEVARWRAALSTLMGDESD